jgi:hypothetical protein
LSRLFTLPEAEELLPNMERLLRTAIESKKSAAENEEKMNAYLVRINLHGGVQLDINRVADIKLGKAQSMERLKQALTEIENSGVLVKDLDVGLIDFPTLLDDTEVYLCWKLGEPHIGFWHNTSEGFAGRKSIDEDFLKHHKGGRPH